VIASYDDAGRIENAIRSSNYPLADVTYDTDVILELVMEPEKVEPFHHWLGELTNGAIIPCNAGERSVEVPAQAEGLERPESQ
jgi:putative IMPACT (imprinted ancient) family translation regulator